MLHFDFPSFIWNDTSESLFKFDKIAVGNGTINVYSFIIERKLGWSIKIYSRSSALGW